MTLKVAFHAGQLLQPVRGGIGTYVRAMLAHLPAEDTSLVAFAAGPRPPGIAARVPWVDLGHPHGSVRYELWHRFRRPVVRIDADIVHAPSLAVPPVAKPLVVTVHDVAFLRTPEATTSRGARFHRRGLELARRHATAVIAPSEFVGAELTREGFDPAVVTVVPFGVDPPRTRDDREIDAEVARVGVKAPFVLTVGTVEPRKDLPTVVRAVEQVRVKHPEITLVINGPPGWGEVTDLDRPFVRMLGEQPWPVVDALYRRAAAFCAASLSEGFGLPALEAMARGAPTIVTSGSAMEEFVGGAGLLFEASDVDGCAAALGRVLDDETVRSELGTAGRERASTMTWQRCAEAHARVYAVVAQDRS